MASINIGIIGLGRMGLGIAQRLQSQGFNVIGFDKDENSRIRTRENNIACSDTIKELVKHVRIFWLMIPAGSIIDTVLDELEPGLQPGDIVIDGGNSFYKDSIRRYHRLKRIDVSLVDCGTSGGLHGESLGYSLMVGGDLESFSIISPILESIAAPQGYAHVGPSGAGHFVKMVHNGIEYALLQSYAEGFHLLHQGPFKDLDLEKISHLWMHGSIIRSWILELAHNVLSKDQNFATISGSIGENKTGQWTVETAAEHNIPVATIKDALDVRAWSRETGGNYATKLVALLRHEFGGHPLKKD